MSTSSPVVAATAPQLFSVWIHDTSDPTTTIREFRYGESGRGSALAVQGVAQQFAGRAFPVWDFGEHESESVTFTLIIPYGDTWDSDLAYLENITRSRKAWVYRDDRGRLLYGFATTYPLDDMPYGTHVSLTIEQTNFDESVDSGLLLFNFLEA